MSAPQRDERPGRLEPVLGRSLAETQRLNDPGQRAARDASDAVRRRMAGGRHARPLRRLALAGIVLLALLGAMAALLRLLGS